MNVAIEAAIIGGFVGAVVGGGIAYYLSRRAIKASFELIRLQDFNKAAAEFRDAFLPEITFLRHNANIGNLGSSNDLGELLRFGYIHRHLKAIEVFKPYLCSKKRIHIDQAFQKYCCNPDKLNELYFQQYSYKSTERETIGEQRKQLALERIEKILEFSKHK